MLGYVATYNITLETTKKTAAKSKAPASDKAKAKALASSEVPVSRRRRDTDAVVRSV